MLWYSLEALQPGASNEYPQQIFSSRNKKNIYLIPHYENTPIQIYTKFHLQKLKISR